MTNNRKKKTATAIASTSAERVRRHRLRKAGLLPPLPICSDCKNPYFSERLDNLCHACWLRTPEGRTYRTAERQRQRQWEQQFRAQRK